MAADLSRIPEYFHRYASLVKESSLSEAFAKHQPESLAFFTSIPEDKWSFRYAPGKWSVREMVQHIIDTERVFQYRALCFSRNDKTDLPSFDENLFASNADADRRSKEDLLKELALVQQSGKALFDSFTPGQLQAAGSANHKEVYVEGMGYILIGHVLHHIQVLKERYL